MQSIPAPESGKTEPFLLRKATIEDLPYLISNSTKEQVHPFTQVGLHHGSEYWQWTIRDAPVVARTRYDCDRDTRIVVDAATGMDVGFAVISHVYELALELFWLNETVIVEEAFYPILRQLVAIQKERLDLRKAQEEGMKDAKPINADTFHFVLHLHPCHPAKTLIMPILAPPEDGPGYRMYTRIYDYPRFIRTVTPELEKRLAHSSMAGTSGRLRLDFYRKVEGNQAKGLEIILENGKIVDAKDWANPGPESAVHEYLAWKSANNIPAVYAAAFAPLTFNTLLMGERSFKELEWAYCETTVKDDASRTLLNILFPKVSQHIDLPFW